MLLLLAASPGLPHKQQHAALLPGNATDLKLEHGKAGRSTALVSPLPAASARKGRTRTVKIPTNSKCSGYGQVADNYYHFLIDFAVRVVNECSLDEPANECDIYIQRCEGLWHDPGRESLDCDAWSNPGQLSIFHPVGGMTERLYNHTFAGRLREHHVSLEELDAMDVPALSFRRFDQLPPDFEHGTCSGPPDDGRSSDERFDLAGGECDEWSRQPPAYFGRFRSAVLAGVLAGGAWERPGLVGAALDAVNHPGILVIERTEATTTRLDDGRALLPALRENLTAWADAEGAPLHFVEPNSNMSVRDQAQLFNSASIVIANHGAACTNVVFCAPGTHFIELPEVLFPCYENLALRSGLNYHTAPQEETLALVACLWKSRQAGDEAAEDCLVGAMVQEGDEREAADGAEGDDEDATATADDGRGGANASSGKKKRRSKANSLKGKAKHKTSSAARQREGRREKKLKKKRRSAAATLDAK